MPKDVDLGPDDYSVRAKSGRWVKRDDFRFLMPYVFGVAALWAGYAWWHRSEIGLVLLVSSIAIPAFIAGIIVGAWLKRFD
jgi:hypothetical protein